MIYKNFNIFYLTFYIYYLNGKFLHLINIPTFQYSKIRIIQNNYIQ
jgi:hypothetical protein